MEIVIVAVRVPIAARVSGSGDKSGAGLDQPASQQDTLSKAMVPVGVLRLGSLLREVKRLLDFRRQDHSECLGTEHIHFGKVGYRFLLPQMLIDHRQQSLSIIDCLRGEGFRQAQVG